MTRLMEKSHRGVVFYRISLLLLIFGFTISVSTVDAQVFSEAEELEQFKNGFRQSSSGLQIGYLVEILIEPAKAADEFLQKEIGYFFYRGNHSYLAHLNLEKLLFLEIYGLSYRIIDKKPLKDLTERWYLVEFCDYYQLELIKLKFEPLFTGKRATLIRIRPDDLKWLIEHNLNFFLIEEVENFAGSKSKTINLPYFFQYNNKLNPGGTCQNTCLAMVLKHYGWTGVPDDITRAWGSKVAQTPEGGARVFNSYAEKLGLPVKASGFRATYNKFRQKLSQGHPLIVHGYFTAGHVVIANSCDGTHYDCHDPAGKWNQIYKGSYNTSVSGKNQKYRKSNFDKAISPDGMVWWVEFNPVVFVD